jgi:hypothetical protein
MRTFYRQYINEQLCGRILSTTQDLSRFSTRRNFARGAEFFFVL